MLIARVEAEEAVNADSFLDIVASVVSVMIIMVMMTGLKIKNTPPDAQPTSEVARAGGDLVQKQHEEQTLRGDVEKIATEMEQVQTQTAVRRARTRYPGLGRNRARPAVARCPAAGDAAIAVRRPSDCC